MVSLNADFNDMQRGVGDTLAAHWKLLMFQGVITIVLGVFAIALPTIATRAVDIYVGWLYVISGIIGLVAMFSARHFPGFLWMLLAALLSTAAGVLLIWKPAEGALALTLLLTAFFFAEGIFQCVTAVAHRDALRGSWDWMLVSGIADLALAAIFLSGWPLSAGWALGFVVGTNLITSGWAIVMAALDGRDIGEGPAPSLATARH